MRNWLRRSLFRRFLLGNLFPILLGFIVMGLVISWSTSQYLKEKAELDMLHQAKSVNLSIQDEPINVEKIKDQLVFLGDAFNKRILLFNPYGKIIATSMADEVYIGNEIEPGIVEKVLEGQEVIRDFSLFDMNRPTLSVIIPWGKENKVYGGIVLNASVEGVGSTFRNIREIVLLAMIFGGIISTVLVSLLTWSITRPLKRIEHAATEIALGNYDKRVDYPHSDEIGELASAFNRMANKLHEIEKHRQDIEQRRDGFIANISHELRTPLTAMQGFLEALQDGLVQDERSKQKYYEVMYEETRYLNRLVNDLMDVIKLRNRKVQLDLYYIKVEELIEKVRFSLESNIKERGNELIVDIPDFVPPLLADADRLEQILKNLLDNANKFTENGQIHIRLYTNDRYMIIEVKDTGIGIASHELHQIWDRFYKIQPRNAKKDERGTGLGLAIIKELVELHDGKIEVRSKLGEGSVFTVRLPLNLPNYHSQTTNQLV